MKWDRIGRVGKGARRRQVYAVCASLTASRAVPTRGHVAGASAGAFAHPTILFGPNAQ